LKCKLRKYLIKEAPASSETSRSPKSGFEGLVTKKDGEWKCAVYSVQNESSFQNCVACEASKPTHKPHEAPSAFTVGSKSQSSESAGSQVGTEFKSNFPEKNFKIGISEKKLNLGMWIQKKTSSFAFQDSSNTEFNSINDGFIGEIRNLNPISKHPRSKLLQTNIQYQIKCRDT
jgi:E3 SUMO-protein ligase RanBP2